MFELYDKDKSGSLDISELEFALSSTLGYIVPLKEVEKLVKKYDDDRSGNLDLKEFTNLANDAKKGRSKFRNLFVYKSKSMKKMEKDHVKFEREKLAKLESQIKESTRFVSARQAMEDDVDEDEDDVEVEKGGADEDVQSKSRIR